MQPTETTITNPDLMMLINNKQEGFNYRRRREQAWRENYELYRDEVTINRLIQRQSVNMPLMKTTLRTLMKDVDDLPVTEFENLDNDLEAESFQNEYWKWTLDFNNAEIQDVVDKKQDFFAGRTFDSWQIVDGKIKWEIEDYEDILVSRFMNPHDLNSSRFLAHIHIFRPLATLSQEKDFNQEEVAKLKEFFKTRLGVVKAADNANTLAYKNQKMADLGVSDIQDPITGETYVELSVQYVFRSGEKDDKGRVLDDQIFVYVEAENHVLLMKKPQELIIGNTSDNWWRNHYRYHSWGDDVDKQDFWTDGIADIVRTPNKVENAYFSQEIENRTLKNYNMKYFDATLKMDGFSPNTFQPIPGGWYPLPGKPQDVFQNVEVQDLSDSFKDIDYITAMVEKATGSNATSQGGLAPSGTPLGEVELAQQQAQQRTKGISKFYTHVWEQRAMTFLKLIEAAPEKLDAVKIYKKGRNTNDLHMREIAPKDWMTESGYRVKVWNQDEKNSQDLKQLQKLTNLKLAMPDNPVVTEIYDRKLAEGADLKPDEITRIMEYEKRKLTAPPMMGQNGAGQPMGQPTGQPTGAPAPNGIPPAVPPSPMMAPPTQ